MSRKVSLRPFGSFAAEDNTDSDDSDYCPGSRSSDEDDVKKRVLKRKSTNASKNSPSKKLTRNAGGTADRKQLVANGSHILRQFPPEILVKVFQHGVIMEGIVKFIPRVSRVCWAWNEVARDPLVWSVMDIPFQTLKLTIAKINGLLHHELSGCKQLNLSGQTKLQDENTMAILSCMPSLRSVNLSDCYHLKSPFMRKLPGHCPHLRRFNMCFTAEFNMNISISSIEYFLGASGKNLVELRLARILSIQTCARQIFSAIEENCPNVEILDISIPDPHKTTTYPNRTFEFDADRFFGKCPRIAELAVDGFNLIRPKKLGPSKDLMKLENLHTLSQSYHWHEHLDNPTFYRMFGATPYLRYLDISKSRLLPSLVTPDLKAVTELVMKDMQWRDSEHSELFECLEAWKHSLVHLDLSFNVLVDSNLDAALLVYGGTEDYPLQNLKLRYTNVTPSCIQTVMKNCTRLQELDLTSCRELPRGCKHLHVKDEFKFLEKCLRRM